MGTAEDTRRRFTETFNRLLGNQLGAPQRNYSDAFLQPFTEKLNYITNGGMQYRDSSSEESEAKKRAITEQERAQAIMQATAIDNSPGFVDTLRNFGKELIVRPMDLAARPYYGLMEGLRNTQESLNAGEPAWSLGDDIAYGIKQGITGQDKTGFGDVFEEATKYTTQGDNWSNYLLANAFPWAKDAQKIGAIETLHGETQDTLNAKRAWGLAGELTLDPVNYVGLGFAVKGAKGVATLGRKALREGIEEGAVRLGKEGIEQTVKKAVADAISDSPVNSVKRQAWDADAGQWYKFTDADAVSYETLRQADKLIYDISGGAQAGKTIVGKEIGRTLAQTAAETHRNLRLRQLDKKTSKFLQAAKAKKLTNAQLNSLKEGDDLFKTFHDEYMDKLSILGPEKAEQAARAAVAKSLAKETDEIFARVLGGIDGEIINVPTLKLFGTDIAHFPKLGNFLDNTGKKISKTQLGNAIKAFNWTSNFPGYSSLISQKARALGSVEYEKFRRGVLTLAKNTTKKDREILQDALETGIRPAGELGTKYDEVRRLYDEMYYQEIAAGVRSNAKVDKMDNYAYVYLRGSKRAREDFLAKRADAIKNGTYTADNFGYKAAQKAGLAPTKDAFENLLYRKMKSNRRLTRQYFIKDLVTHYGVKGTVSPSEAVRRSLVPVKKEQLPKELADTLKEGERFFIDRDIKEIYDYYTELTKIGSNEAGDLLRAWDYVTRKFKTWNTIYFPAFHIRNFISDMYLGAVDGVTIKDYRKIMKGFLRRDDPKVMLDLGGETVTYKKVYDAFESNAASGGFFSAELDDWSRNKLTTGARKFSEQREDFGRFSHFYHAMTEEYPAALKKYKDKDKAWDAAVNASTYRVNKYKFDYGALTKTEQRFMRRGIPFYTYTRKAIPTLMEALFLSPRNLSATSRFFEAMSFEDSEEFMSGLIPDWMREVGFAQITGGSEPTGLSANFLPQNVFNDAGTNPASMLNPLIRAPFELKYGEDTFSGRPVNGLEDLLYNNLRVSQYLPPAVSPGDNTPKLWNPDVSALEKLGMVTGIPMYTVTKERQEQALQDMIFDLKGSIRGINSELNQYGYNMYLSDRGDGVSIRIKTYNPADPEGYSGEVVGEYTSLQEAMAAAKKLTGQK